MIKSLIVEIHYQMPRLLTLNQFFIDYDIYEGRVLQAWEMKVIFPSSYPYLDYLHNSGRFNS